MKTSVLVEAPIVTLRSDFCDFQGGRGEEINLYAKDFKEATVGKIWSADYTGSCRRGNNCESLEVVYKNKRGVAVLYRNWGTTNADNPKDWAEKPKLWWIEIA
jgi:hypothetical protein